jgi:hypothetical protein
VGRHVPIPNLTQNFGVLGFGVLGTALGFGFWIVWEFRVLDQFWVWVSWVWGSFGFCVGIWVSILPVNYDNGHYEKHYCLLIKRRRVQAVEKIYHYIESHC